MACDRDPGHDLVREAITVPSGAGTGVVHLEIRGGATLDSAELTLP